MKKKIWLAHLLCAVMVFSACQSVPFITQIAGENDTSNTESFSGSDEQTVKPNTLPVVDPMKDSSVPETKESEKPDESSFETESETSETESLPEVTSEKSSESSSSEMPEATTESTAGSTEESSDNPPADTSQAPTESSAENPEKPTGAETKSIGLDSSWKYADESVINSGSAVLYYAKADRKGIVIGVNAGHGTSGGSSVKTWCHPDHTPKVTGGTTSEGATKAMAVSSGMDFNDGTSEAKATLKVAKYLKDMLLKKGYDVLMLRDGSDVQLDNVARTVICNNAADCHISIHYDSDGLSYDKGAYYMSVPDGLKGMYPVSDHWRDHEALGDALIKACKDTGYKVWSQESMDMDLTQTSYSTVPSVDIEMGNQCTAHDDDACWNAAAAIAKGVDYYFSN